jgi:hypothetical protein
VALLAKWILAENDNYAQKTCPTDDKDSGKSNHGVADRRLPKRKLVCQLLKPRQPVKGQASSCIILYAFRIGTEEL